MKCEFLFINNSFDISGTTDCGASVRSTKLIDALRHIGHVDIINFHETRIEKRMDCCNVIYDNYLQQTAYIADEHNAAKRLRKYVKPLNPYSHFTLCREKEDIIDSAIRRKHYDFIVCRYISESIRCGIIKYSDRLIVDVDDNPYNETIRTLASIKLWQPWKYITGLYRAYSVHAMSKKILDDVCLSFYSNRLEPPHRKSVYLHNVPGIIEESPSFACKENHRLLIVGWMDYAPNRYGVIRFVERIFPRIKKAVPDATLHIAGKNRDKKLSEWLNSRDGVSALGFVDDLQKEYDEAQIVVIPIYHGSGTSVKFIEAISMAKPVVSTPYGTRGFDDMCKEGKDFLCAHNDREFAEKTVSLLTSSEECHTLARNAYTAARTNLTRNSFCETVKSAIVQLEENGHGN